MARYTLVIPGRLDNLNDYISDCRTNQYKGSKIKASNEHKVLVAIYEQLGRLRIANLYRCGTDGTRKIREEILIISAHSGER